MLTLPKLSHSHIIIYEFRRSISLGYSEIRESRQVSSLADARPDLALYFAVSRYITFPGVAVPARSASRLADLRKYADWSRRGHFREVGQALGGLAVAPPHHCHVIQEGVRSSQRH